MAAKASLGLGASLTDRRFRNAAGEPCISRPPGDPVCCSRAVAPASQPLATMPSLTRRAPGPCRGPWSQTPTGTEETPSLPPSSAEALGGGCRVSRSGLHLPSRRVARLWWRGLRGQTPRHREAPCPRAGPLPPGSAGHPHAGLTVPARLTPGPSSLRLRGLHLQPVNETRSSSTRGRLPECGGGCGRRHTADPGAATPASPLCQSPPPHPRHRLETPDPRFLPVLAARSQARTREPGRGTGGGVLRERGRSEKHPPPRSDARPAARPGCCPSGQLRR